MPRLNPLPSPSRLRERRHQRSRRLLASRAVADTLVSVAGLIGRPVRNPSGAEIGTVKDVVARWDGGEYPPVSGLVIRVGRRLAFVPAGADRDARPPRGRAALGAAGPGRLPAPRR